MTSYVLEALNVVLKGLGLIGERAKATGIKAIFFARPVKRANNFGHREHVMTCIGIDPECAYRVDGAPGQPVQVSSPVEPWASPFVMDCRIDAHDLLPDTERAHGSRSTSHVVS